MEIKVAGKSWFIQAASWSPLVRLRRWPRAALVEMVYVRALDNGELGCFDVERVALVADGVTAEAVR